MRLYFYTLLILIISQGNAQKYFSTHPVYHHLSIKEDLPDTQFYGIIEDHKGFIWLAADNGLYRYDGKKFKLYSHPEKRGSSVFCLKLDSKGSVWCSNLTGQIFYVEDDELRLFLDLKKYTENEVPEFYFLGNNLVISNNISIFIIDILTKKVKELKNYRYNYILAYQEEDQFYGIFNGKVYVFDKDFINSSLFDQSIILKDNLLYSWNYPDHNKLLNTHNQDIIINEKLNRIFKNPSSYYEKLVRFKAFRGNLNFFIEKNTIWQCTTNGIDVFEFKDQNIHKKTTYLKGNYITDILKDQNGNYWITTLNNGVFIFPNCSITSLTLPLDNRISALAKENNHTLLVGNTKGELSRINTSTKEVESVKLPYQSPIISIASSKNQTYVSQNHRAFVFDNRLENYDWKKNFKNGSFINAKDISIIDDSSFIYTSSYFSYIYKDKKKHPLKEERSFASFYSKTDKKTYIASLNGLFVYDENFKEQEITYNNRSLFVNDIDQTNNGIIWLSTNNDGILGIKDNTVISKFSIENGLLSNKSNLIKGDKHNLWIANPKALQRLDTRSNSFKNLTQKDGVNTFNINGIEICKNHLFLSSNIGLQKLELNTVFKEKSTIDLYFTNVLIENKEVSIKNHYTLNPSEKKIQFKFHANGYLTTENLTLYYKLKQHDTNWNIINDQSYQITFNSLSADNYTLIIKAVDVNGQVCITDPITIIVELPFYKKTWTILIFISFIILFIWWFFNRKIKIVKQKQKDALNKERIERHLISSQLENLRSQMNPHFIFNALNSIQEYVVLNEKKLASTYLIKFSRLIRLFLEHSQKQYVSLKEEIEALTFYLELEKDRFENTFDFYLNFDKNIDLSGIEVPSVFIQPYVENAIKHGLLHKKDNRKLWIEFIINDKELICIIEDNGIGRQASYKLKTETDFNHKSFAIKANNKRINLINSQRTKKIIVHIYDKYNNDLPAGTKVYITIPF